MDDRDRRARQRHAGVQRLDLGVVPGLDLAQEDVAEGLAVELQAGFDAREVVGDGDRAQEHRDLDGRAAVLGDRFFIGGLQRRVAGAEVDDLALDRRDAGTGADRLVVDGQAGLRGGPLFVDGRGERRARAGDRSRGRGRRRGGRCWSAAGRARSAGRARTAARCQAQTEQRTTRERAHLVSDHWVSLNGCRKRRVGRPGGAGRLVTGRGRGASGQRGACMCTAFRHCRRDKRPLHPGNSLFNRRCPPCEHFVKAGVGSGSRSPGGCG